jgi:serine/threonine protein kinase
MNFLRRLFGWESPVFYGGRESNVKLKPAGQFEKKTMMIPDSQLKYQRSIPQIGEVKKIVEGGTVLNRRKLGKGGCGIAESVKFVDAKGKKRVFVQKTANDAEEGRYEAEICSQVQRTVSILSRGMAAFWRLGSTFVPQFIGEAVSDIGEFTNCYERVPGQELQKSLFMDPEEIDRKIFSSQSARVGAQIASALAVLHASGIVHRDLKPENIVYDPFTKTAKLIDFGLGFKYTRQLDEDFLTSKEDVLDELAKKPEKPAMSREDALKVPSQKEGTPLVLASYCASIEQYQLKAKIKQLDKEIGKRAEKMRQRCEIVADMALITRPAVDVYGLGMLLPAIFFRKIGGGKFFMNAFPRGKNAQANVLNRQNFEANIERNMKSLNEMLPANLQYDEAQLLFITKLTRGCVNPNPLMRPTAAQVCALLEAFDAGMLDFNAAWKLAKEDRPSEAIPEATLEVYRNHHLIYDS